MLPLVWNVTTDEMLLRQQAVTDMAIVSTRPISQEGRVHLEDQLIQQHLNDLQQTTIQPFKKMAAVQESIAEVHGRRLCKLLHQDHFPFVRLLPPEQHGNGVILCNCQEEDAVQKLQAIKDIIGATFLRILDPSFPAKCVPLVLNLRTCLTMSALELARVFDATHHECMVSG